jgi:hypothetical protein
MSNTAVEEVPPMTIPLAEAPKHAARTITPKAA